VRLAAEGDFDARVEEEKMLFLLARSLACVSVSVCVCVRAHVERREKRRREGMRSA